jgi:hypothetical protein
VTSCTVLRLQHPPAIRLLNTNSHKAPSRSPTPSISHSDTPAFHPPLPVEPDFLSALTLSTNPVITPTNPVFGLPSLLSSPLPPTVNEEVDADAMDWTPTDPGQHRPESAKQPDDGSWLRPQRFFAPEKPTGLEGLFERALIVNDTPMEDKQNRLHIMDHAQSWWRVYALSFVPIAAVTYKAWEHMRGAT